MNYKYPLSQSQITGSDIAFVATVMARPLSISTATDTVNQFENAILEYTGTTATHKCIATNSGTAALHLAMLANNISAPDTIHVPALTFAATAHAISYVGASIAIHDVDAATWTLDTSQLPAAITESERCIGVSLYGAPCTTRIIDACQSLQNIARDTTTNTSVITPDTTVCISFNGNKIITTGGGGAIIIPSSLYQVAYRYATQGKDNNNNIIQTGYNYRMPGLNAALGLSQLTTMAKRTEFKRNINAIYKSYLDHLVIFQQVEPCTPWLVACTLPKPHTPDAFIAHLATHSIEARRVFMPLHWILPYRNTTRICPNAEYIYTQGVCLPSDIRLTANDLDYICNVIKNYLTK